MLGSSKSIRVDELAAFMIDAAMNGREESTIQDNEAMVKKGREALVKMKAWLSAADIGAIKHNYELENESYQ